MIIKKIKINNCGPFLGINEVKINLGSTVVVGKYDDNQFRSNRSGKSWFAMDALLFALYGKYRGKNIDNIVHKSIQGKKDAWIEYEVQSSNNRNWVIRRGRTKNGDPITKLNGSNISKNDLDEIVEKEIVGLNYNEYCMTNGFIQGQINSFMEMGNSDKLKLISTWFRTDRWNKRYNYSKSKLNKVKNRLDFIEEQLEHYENIRDEKEIKDKLNKLEKNYTIVEFKYNRLYKKFLLISNNFNLYKEKSKELKEYQSLLEECEDLLEDLEIDIVNAKKHEKYINRLLILEKEVKKILGIKEDINNCLIRITKELNIDRKEYEQNECKYDKFKRKLTGICPILKEECNRIEKDNKVLVELTKDNILIGKNIIRLKKNIDKYKEEHGRICLNEYELNKEIKELSKYKNNDNIEELLNNKKLLEKDYNVAKIGIKKSKEFLDRINIENKEEIEQKLNRLDNKRIRLENEILKEKIELKECEKKNKEKIELNKRKEELKELIDNLTWANYAFSPNGISSREIENAFDSVEYFINNMLINLNSGLSVNFKPNRELKEFEKNCLTCGYLFKKGEKNYTCKRCGSKRLKKKKDDFNLVVYDNNNESSFELDSGGGKILISIAIRLGLSQLASIFRNVTCEHIIIDEPDGSLDIVARKKLYSLIKNKLGNRIKQVMLITHTDAMNNFKNIITINRKENEYYSEIIGD